MTQILTHHCQMAIWQFDLSPYPRHGPQPWRAEDGHEVPPLETGRAAVAHAWLQQRFGEPSQQFDDWFMFGQDQGNRIDLSFQEDRSANLFARIDARSNHGHFVGLVCELARLSDCLLFSPELWLTIEPTAADVLMAMHRSRAVAFVKNPLDVLLNSPPRR